MGQLSHEARAADPMGHLPWPRGPEPGSVFLNLLTQGVVTVKHIQILVRSTTATSLTRTWILPPTHANPSEPRPQNLLPIFCVAQLQSKMTTSLLFQRERGSSGNLRPLRGTLCRPCSPQTAAALWPTALSSGSPTPAPWQPVSSCELDPTCFRESHTLPIGL